jgi:integrase
MEKALRETRLEERFREHDLRAKVGSDAVDDLAAQIQLAHSDGKVTRKHYRRRSTEVPAAAGYQGEVFRKYLD